MEDGLKFCGLVRTSEHVSFKSIIKLGIISENKIFQNVICEKCSLELLFITEKENWNFHEKIYFEIKFLALLTLLCRKNTINYFSYVDIGPKILLKVSWLRNVFLLSSISSKKLIENKSHSSKIEFIRWFFGGNLWLIKSFWFCQTFNDMACPRGTWQWGVSSVPLRVGFQ